MSKSRSFLKISLSAFALTAALSMSAQAKETTTGIACMQFKPNVERGFIIEDAVIVSSNGKDFELQLKTFGKGLLTSDGDGTVSEVWYEGTHYLKPRPDLAASSPQWRKAVPFLVPVRASLGQMVLYIQPKDLKAPGADFTVRLKVTKGGKVSNFSLFCNEY